MLLLRAYMWRLFFRNQIASSRLLDLASLKIVSLLTSRFTLISVYMHERGQERKSRQEGNESVPRQPCGARQRSIHRSFGAPRDYKSVPKHTSNFVNFLLLKRGASHCRCVFDYMGLCRGVPASV